MFAEAQLWSDFCGGFILNINYLSLEVVVSAHSDSKTVKIMLFLLVLVSDIHFTLSIHSFSPYSNQELVVFLPLN